MPGFSERTRYKPSSLVTVLNVKFVPICTTVTFAPGITAPLESVIRPDMVDVPICAWTREAVNRHANKRKVLTKRLIIYSPVHTVWTDATVRCTAVTPGGSRNLEPGYMTEK